MDGRTRSAAVTAQAYGPGTTRALLLFHGTPWDNRLRWGGTRLVTTTFGPLCSAAVNQLANAGCKFLHPAIGEVPAPRAWSGGMVVHLGLTGAGDFRDFSPLLSAK
jgi:hypothetical protein